MIRPFVDWKWTALVVMIVAFMGCADRARFYSLGDLIRDHNDLSGKDFSYIERSMGRLNFIQKMLFDVSKKSVLQMDEAVNVTAKLGPEQRALLFEGDMLLTPRQMNSILQNVEHQLFLKDIGRLDLLEHPKRQRRTLISNPVARWTGLPIPYRILEERSARREVIYSGIRLWEQNTCLKFVERTTPVMGPHIQFIRGSGCYSNVGRSSLSGQFVSIGRGCENPLIVAHEIGHSLGFFHEQSRYDRDKYIRVDEANIHSSFYNQFTKQEPDMLQTFDVEYDIGESSFSFTGNPAIHALDPNYQNTMGQRHELTFNDVKKINSAYCATTCSTSLNCQNSGYTDPRNCKKCRCPAGLGGKQCTKARKTRTDCGRKSLTLKATTVIEELEIDGVKGECNFLVKSPEGTKIQLRIEQVQFLPSLPCKNNYLEVKYGRDLGTTGARFCDKTTAMPNIITRTNQAVVIFRSQSTSSRFRISYSSDEATTPLNVFTSSFAIFSELIRNFFHSDDRKHDPDEDEFYDDVNTSPPSHSNSSYNVTTASATKTSQPSLRTNAIALISLEGSGIDEIMAAEGFLEALPLPVDGELLMHELLEIKTRRKPVNRKLRKKIEHKAVRDEDDVLEASGYAD